MPKRQVMELVCERCGRRWYVSADDEGAQRTPTVGVRYTDSKEVSQVDVCFNVLCQSCSKTVLSCLRSVAKSLDKRSPTRKTAKKKESGPPEGAHGPKPPFFQSR